MAKVVLKGGPGSGHRGHAGRPGKRGGSLPGGGAEWSSYVGSLNEKFGVWSDERVARLKEDMTVSLSKSIRSTLVAHAWGPRHEQFSVEDLRRRRDELEEVFSTEELLSQLRDIEQLTHWDLAHQADSDKVRVFHGMRSGDGAIPNWISSVKENFCTTPVPRTAVGFASMRGSTILEFNVPIRNVKMSWRSADMGKVFENDWQFIMCGGDYTKYLTKAWTTKDFHANKSFQNSWNLSVITGESPE